MPGRTLAPGKSFAGMADKEKARRFPAGLSDLEIEILP